MASGPLLIVEREARVYRNTWRGSVISTFLSPVLFLLAMGVGLGSLVDEASGGVNGVSYLEFLAPGLLAATAMQTAAFDSSWPVMAGIKWTKNYHAALSTPIVIRDLVIGHLGWVAIRLTFVSVAFSGVMWLFSAVTVTTGLLAVPPAVLTGLAFAAPIMAFTGTQESEVGLSSLFRFGIVPLFLFSGTFFPISQLPDVIEPIAYVTPLWHGVELARAAALSLEPTLPVWLHVAYLAVFVVGGAAWGLRSFTARLQK